jgi:hypothetical protein
MIAILVVAMSIAPTACAQRTTPSPGEAQATPSTAPISRPSASVTTPVMALTHSLETTEPPVFSEKLPFAIDAIREYLASQLTLPVDQVTLISWQAIEWRDACLGVHKPGEECLTVITPGFTLKFQAGATTSMVNTDATGINFRLAQEPETPADTTSSGIGGQVFIGPTCGGPVSQNSSTECADKPYAATIIVLDPAGQMVTSFITDAEGRFRFPLPPGEYILHPETTGKLPRAIDQQIIVVSGQFLTVTIMYDSGIR